MNPKKSILLVISIIIVASLSLVSMASAGSAGPGANVITTNAQGYSSGTYQTVTEFNTGERAYILLTGIQAGKTADISVENFDTGELVPGAQWKNVPNGTVVSFLAPPPGNYSVNVNGIRDRLIASASIFVLPESAAGTLMVLGAGFAAVGVVGLIKTPKTPNTSA